MYKKNNTMTENKKYVKKHPTEIEWNDEQLSIIYVRKTMPKIIQKLNTTGNVNVERKQKILKHNKLKILKCLNQKINSYLNEGSYLNHKKIFSMPAINYSDNEYKTRSSGIKSWTDFSSSNINYFKSKFLVYLFPKTQYQHSEYPHLFHQSSLKPSWKIYRCQLNTQEESCCCSCNSDAMFEVMKSLYDCYKKKNCDNCNCILCGHLPREERRLGELRKSGVSLPLTKVEQKKRKKSKQKIKEKVSLKGKSRAEKEQVLKDLILSGEPLPEPKTKSDKELIKKIQAELGSPREVKLTTGEKLPKSKVSKLIPLLDTKKIPSDKMHKLKEAGLLTPLEGKSSEQKEKILTGLAMNGIPLPKGKTASDKKLIEKVRKDVGLPPEPKTSLDKKKYDEAMSKGLITPLQGKSALEKEKILKGQADLGLTLPEGRTASEKKLIAKVIATKGEPLDLKIPSAKLQKSKLEGILTPLQGKTSEEKENIIKDLAMKGIPLPEGKTASEKKLINKVRAEVGLPPQPKTPSTKEKYAKAMEAGLIVPLEGKTDTQKEKILKEQAKMGLPLPEGRTPSERALVAKVKAEIQTPSEIPVRADKIKEVKAVGLITPLQGKTPEQKEKILRDLVMRNVPLPEAKTASERQIIDKVRKSVGLPPEPKSKKEKSKYKQAVEAGLITPLEGKPLSQKQRILQGQADLGLELPEGRSPSEKALIKKIKSSKKKPRRKTSIEGVLPPDKRKKLDEKTLKVLKEGKGPSDECICGLIAPELEKITKESKILKPSEKLTKTGDIQTPQQKEKILRELAKQGAPLPEAKTVSEKKILEKVQADLGLPTVPTTPSLKEKYMKAQKAGIIVPLDGKTPSQKEKILTKQAEMGITLPEGRTPSEKALVNKIRATVKPETGLLTPLQGKSPEEKKRIIRNIIKAGLPLPEGKTPSEKQMIKKVKDDIGLPSKGIPSEMFRKAKAAGLITPLEDKTQAEKEKILRDRAAIGLPLPEGVTPSDKALIKKIKTSTGYTSPKISPEKIQKSKTAGLLTPLEGKTPSQREKMLIGKTPSQKEKLLRNIAKQGLSLPAPKTLSEKALIDKVQAEAKMSPEIKPLSAKLKLAKAAGLLTPLEGKTPEQKEKILKGLIKAGIPLPEGKSSSEKKLIEKVREEVGLPPEPKTSLMKNKMKQAQLAGIITPLEGKTPSEKEKILKKMHDAGIPLPKGRTASEKSLIKKIKAEVGTKPKKATSVRADKAKATGLLTPLEGKTPAQKEKIIRELAKSGLPLPEGKTPSEKAIINKIKAERLHPLPPAKIEKLDKKTAKVIKEGKGPSDECICDLLTPIPEPSFKSVSPEKLRKIKTAELLASLSGKTPEQIEKKLKDLALQGIPLPEAKTASEKKLINKIRADIGLPPEPKTPSLKEKYNKGMAAGLITPLQGKSKAQKEKILTGQARMGLPLPEGRTPSEKDLIAKIKATTLPPLEGKSPEQKDKILRDLALQGIPFPEAKTPSEKKIMDKVRFDLGLPPEPKTSQEKEKYKNAIAAGIITPLQGKSASQKEKILRGQAQMGLDLPKPRTSSEKALIDKIRMTPEMRKSAEKIRKSQAPSLLTPLEGKTSKQKEQILKGMAMQGIPLPEPKTGSEKKLMDKVRVDLGLPPEPKTSQEKEKYKNAIAAGIITPLQGKSASQKEKILRGQAQMGLDLPKPRTSSEKALIDKIRMTPEMRKSTEKIRKSQAPSLLTPLEGKTSKQKEQILKGMVMQGIPLPEPKTGSEKKLMDKVRVDLGLPPEPKTSQEKVKYKNAIAAGIITPLQGKSASQKEKILRGQAQMGLDLPKPRTSSEKALIDKIKMTPEIPLTPLEGKTSKQKEQILKDLAMQGIPLPEPKTGSEKKIIDKVRADVGLPPEPKTASIKEKYNKARAEGLITPLQGKSAAQKEKILRGQAKLGLPLPEGRTPSEKALISKIKETAPSAKPTLPTEKPIMPPEKIAKLDKKTAKVMKEKKGPSDECICHILSPKGEKEGVVASAVKAISKKSTELYKIPSEKLRKAKDAGLLTPLQGKSLAQKEKILKGLAKQGLPLPEAKTVSEKKLIDKVRSEIGLPPEPKTKSVRKIYDKAMAAGYITPLEGKSEAQKERILRKEAELGLPLPQGRTPSEKRLIARIKQKVPPPSEAKAPAPLPSLEGKSSEEKEKILKNLAEAGLPLPEGKTASEKSLIHKIKSEYAKQEKKGKMKTKSKKIGVASVRRSKKHVGLSKGAITEEFQDVIKTTTCDRGCGCDKKKIRFKHSYVKIRVTSPDISSLCPCPEECVPGVKGGIFTDNEGIKVTVGRVTGTPSFSSKKSFDDDTNVKMYKSYFKPSYISLSGTSFTGSYKSISTPQEYYDTIYYNGSNIYNSKSDTEINIQKCYINSYSQYNSIKHSLSYNSMDIRSNFLKKNGTLENMVSLKEHCSDSILSLEFSETDTSANTSFELIHLLNRNSSVSLVTVPNSISVFSFSTSGSSSISNFYAIKKDLHSYNGTMIHGMSTRQKSKDSFSTANSIRNYECYPQRFFATMTCCENNEKHDLFMFRTNKSKTCNLMELHNSNKKESNIYADELSNSISIHQLICRMLSGRRLNNTSSLIVIISTSSDEQSSQYSLRTSSSTIGIDLFENNCNWNYKANSLHHLHQNQRGFKITATGRLLRKTVISPIGNRCKSTNVKLENEETDERNSIIKENNNRKHQILKKQNKNCRIISTDTTQDRPCCCEVKEDKLLVSPYTGQSRMDSIVTELVTPILLKEANAQGLDHEAYVNSPKNKVICQPRLPTSHSNCRIPIDRRSKIPCRHHSTQICDSSSLNDTNFKNTFKTCNCDPDKLKEYFDKRTEEIISKGCDISNNEFLVKNESKKKLILNGTYNSTNELCESCGSSIRDKKTCNKKIKQVCPCEQHEKKPSTVNYIENQLTDNNISSSNHCKCKEEKRFKKIICECPEEPEPEIDLTEWIDERQIRKLKSDLTQTISGFKINKPRKKDNWENRDFEMRFEEALKYIAENLENKNNKYNNEDCSCTGNLGLNSKSISVDCECPDDSIPVDLTEQASEEEPFTGIKFHINGKGSESKGLNGILCFELLNT